MQKPLTLKESLETLDEQINRTISQLDDPALQMALRTQVSPILTTLKGVMPYLTDRTTFPTARSNLLEALRYLNNVSDLSRLFPTHTKLLKQLTLTVREQIRDVAERLAVQIRYDDEQLSELQHKTQALKYQLANIILNPEKQTTINQILMASRQSKIKPTCFISYAWPTQTEAWVQPFLLQLYQHLQAAGIQPKLDLIDNAQGDNIYEFMRQAHECDYVLLIGTPSLLKQHSHPCWRAAKVEMSHIIHKQNQDVLIDETRVIPILLQGTREESFLPFQQKETVIWDWREQGYCQNLTQLIDRLLLREANPERWQGLWEAHPELANPFSKSDLEQQRSSLQAYYDNAVAELVKRDTYTKLSQQRDADHLSELALQQERIVLPETITPFDGRFHCPLPFPDFTGRAALLSELENHADQHTSTVITHTQKISGTGGIGKTQVAVSFANKMLAEHQQDPRRGFAAVIWLYAGSDDQRNTAGLLHSQLIELGLQLGIDTAVYKGSILYRTIYQRLQQRGRTLVVFDNGHCLKDIAPYLPPENGTFHVLITSRNSHELDWKESFHVITLDIFSEEEALQYIQKVLSRKKESRYEEVAAKQLAKELGYFPLALTQALAVINAHNLSIEAYLERFAQQKKYYLNKEPSQGDAYVNEKNRKDADYQPHHATVWTTLQLCLDRITSEEAKTILHACSYLAPEVPIDNALLERCAKDTTLAREGLEILRRYSLVENSNLDNRVRIHQVVQDVLRLEMTVESKESLIQSWCDIILSYFDIDTGIVSDLLEEIKYFSIRPHAESLVSHLELLPKTDQCCKAQAAMYGLVGTAYSRSGAEAECKRSFEAQASCYKKMSDLPIIEYYNCQINLACSIRRSGNVQAAIELLENTLKIIMEKFKEDDPIIYNCLFNLSSAISESGNSNEAKVLLKKVSQFLISRYGADHSVMGGYYLNLGWLTTICGNPKKGIKLLEKALSIQRNHFGNEHYFVGAILMNLGIALVSTGDTQNAITKFEEALRILKSALGERHFSVGRCLMNLGSVLADYIDSNRAKNLFEEALSIFKSTEGEEHYNVGQCLSGLGTIMLHSDSQAAKKLFEDALLILKPKLGDGNVIVETTKLQLGLAMLKSGEPNKAKLILKEVLFALKLVLKKHDYRIGHCLLALAEAMLNCGEPQEAKTLLGQALVILTSALGKNHLYAGRCLLLLGKAHLACDECQCAREFLEKALPIFGSLFKQQGPEVGECLRLLVIASEINKPIQGNESLEMGRYLYRLGTVMLAYRYANGAIELFSKSLEILKISNAEAYEVGRCLRDLGVAKLVLNPTESISLLREALQVLEAQLGDNNKEVGICLKSLGRALLDKNFQEANVMLRRALPILKSTHGKDNIEVGICLKDLGWTMIQYGNLFEAEKILTKAAQILRHEQSSELGICLLNLGGININKDPHSAKVFLQESLTILRLLDGKIHMNVGECLANLGWATIFLGDPEEAKNYFFETLEIFEQILSVNNPKIGGCLMGLGKAELLCKNPQVAMKHLQRAINIFLSSNDNHSVQCLKLLVEAEKECSMQNSELNSQNWQEKWSTDDPSIAIRRATEFGTLQELTALLNDFILFANQNDNEENKGYTPLHIAVIKNRPEYVEVLLNSIGYTTLKDAKESTALDYAMRENYVEMLHYFLAALVKYYSNYEINNTQLPKLIRICAQLGDESGLKLLVHLEVPVDEAGPSTGQTALHRAVIKKHIRCVQLLLSAGADHNLQDSQGKSPLDYAANDSELLTLFKGLSAQFFSPKF